MNEVAEVIRLRSTNRHGDFDYRVEFRQEKVYPQYGARPYVECATFAMGFNKALEVGALEQVKKDIDEWIDATAERA